MSQKKTIEQARRWREERKELKELARGVRESLAKEKGGGYDSFPMDGFEPLTEEEQAKALLLIGELRHRLGNEQNRILAEMAESMEKGEGDWKGHMQQASQCVGRDCAYELLGALFLGKDGFYGKVKKQLLATADEWGGAHKDDR